MSRLPFTYGCAGLMVAGTLDEANATTGLLIVTGGSEIRSGAFNSQSHLAKTISEAGFPVFRFDRRGIGDSDGQDRGFRKSQTDIAAAIEAFKVIEPQVDRVIGFGNCDAASALMLGSGLGCDGLVLSNPWTIEDDVAALPPAAIRSRYAEKLRNPKDLARLLKGGVDLRKLLRGLLTAMKPAPARSSLAEEMAAGLAKFEGPVSILLANRDRTAQMFETAWDKTDNRIRRCNGADHAYSAPEARQWLVEQLLTALKT